MSINAHWVRLTECNTGLDADILRASLEAEDVPVQLRSNVAGVFGATFQGSVTGGIDVYVPSPMFERAQAILREHSPIDTPVDDE